MTERANVGDIILCWRPAFVLSEHYKAVVVSVVGPEPIYEVKPVRGLFRWTRFVAGIFCEGIVERVQG